MSRGEPLAYITEYHFEMQLDLHYGNLGIIFQYI